MKLRGAIVGLGQVAMSTHLPVWKKSDQAEIVAAVDSSPERRDAFSRQEPSLSCYPDIKSLKPNAIDFVDICTPPHTHGAIAALALNQKWHVLCEKPLVLDISELESLSRLSHSCDRALVTVHNWSYAPICRKISEILSADTLGDIRHCAWFVLRDGPALTAEKENWRTDPQKAGGGILIDHGWHAFYLLLGWLNKKPFTVSASLENRQYGDLPVEDTVKAKIEFDSGNPPKTTAEIFLTWASRVRRNWGVIQGEKAALQIEDDSLKCTPNTGTDAQTQTYNFNKPLSESSRHPEWFQPVISEFAREINEPASRGKNLSASRDCLKLINACKLSHQKSIAVPF